MRYTSLHHLLLPVTTFKSLTRLNLATWNVRTMTTGIDSDFTNPEIRKSAVIADELERLNIDICALSETRLSDQGTIREHGYSFYWIGYPADMRRIHGVGFAVRNNISSFCVEAPVGFSERLMKLCLQCAGHTCHIISAYAPTLVSPPEEKDRFYDSLSNLLLSLPPTDSVFILGDFNARVGRDSEAWPDVLGPHGTGNMNENGQRLLELCCQFSLRVMSTYFQGSERSKVTWQHPRSKQWHQLDHVLSRRSTHNFIRHVRSLHSADCNSDHALVRCKILLPLKKSHTARVKPKPRLNVCALKNDIDRVSYQSTLSEKLSAISPHENLNDACSSFSTCVLDSAKSSLGFLKRKQPDWYSASVDVISPILSEKRRLRNAYMSNPSQENADRFKEIKSKAQRVSRQCFEKYWNDLSSRIQLCSDTGNLRGLYKGIKEALGPKPRRIAPVLDANGQVLTDSSQQMTRWVQYFTDLYSRDAPVDMGAINSIPELPVLLDLDALPTTEEVNLALKQLNNNKASGDDDIPAELLVSGGDSLLRSLTTLIVDSWSSGSVPQQWKNSKMITLYKNKGDRRDCNSYRAISLLSVAGKVMARVALRRLNSLASRVYPESQCGFRSGRSTIDMIFTLRQLQEKCVEQSRPLVMAFIDLTKAFDLVNREALYVVLRRIGCPPRLLSVLRSFHDGMQATVQFEGTCSDLFDITIGVKQGCVLAPTLFGIFFSVLLQHAFPDPTGISLSSRSDGSLFNLARLRAKTKVRQVLIRELLYADDAVFFAYSEQDLQSMCDAFASACSDFGVTISISKTKVMSFGLDVAPSIYVNGSTLENVDQFCYLGSSVSSRPSLEVELGKRLGKAATTFGNLQDRVWSNKTLTTRTKVQVYEACVLSILLYGCESWPSYSHQERRLNAFHMRCLRKIVGISWEDKVPDVRILEITHSTNLTTIIRSRRLRWIGHVRRMEEDRIPKLVFFGELSIGKRPKGRPRLRYKDTIKRDLKDFAIPSNTWEQLAADRPTWRASIRAGTSESVRNFESMRMRQHLARQRKLRPENLIIT